MTDCPPRLRGDLSKWLCEINTGVYVGQLSSRVRDALWDRVCKNLQTGRATMVYTTNGEQKMDFRVHNTSWTPVDFDGIKLMRRPLPQGTAEEPSLKPGFSKAAKRQMAARRASARLSAGDRFVLIDLETTGLQPGRDEIIEFGALRIDGDKETEFSCLVRPAGPLPKTIAELTGLTDETLQAQGLAMEQALQQFLTFIGRDKLVGYNLSFDMAFLRAACQRTGQLMPANRSTDLLNLARRKISGVSNFKLTTLAAHFALPQQASHRALADCRLMKEIYSKLNE